jgi:hypothetical protein
MLSIEKSVKLTGDFYGKLEDGTPLATDNFNVGHQVFVLDPSGNKKPAPDGDHITYIPTANGNKRFIMVVKDGTIQALEFNDSHNAIVDKVNYENDPNLYKQDTNMVQKQELATMGPDVPGKVTTNDESGMVKEIQDKGTAISLADGDVASRLDALDAQLKQLRDDVANIYNHLKSQVDATKMEAAGADQIGKVTSNDEAAKVAEIQKKGLGLKKFTGAPVEANESNFSGIVKNKTHDAFSRVFDKMANSKL